MNMRAMQGLVIGVTAAVTLGCATHAVKVRTDVDQTANVGRYVTFFMEDGNSSGDKAIDQRIKSDVESALASQGWIEAPPDEGQAIVIAHVVTAAKQSSSALYAGWGGWQWHIGGPGARPVEQYQVGSLVIDIFDARSRQAIWRGVATDAVPAPTARPPWMAAASCGTSTTVSRPPPIRRRASSSRRPQRCSCPSAASRYIGKSPALR
jgi:hypothetical protein